MKTNLKLYCAACLLMAALGSCSHEAAVEGAPEGAGKETRTVTVQATLGDESRIAFKEDETSLHLLWEENDAFSVLAGTAVQIPATFTLSEGAGTNKGVFSGEIACDEGDALYAVWPLMEDTMSVDNQYYWSLDGQQGVLDDRYTYMVGKGSYTEEGNVRMSFSYCTAAFRMKLALPAGVKKISQVSLNTYSGVTVSLNSGGLIYDGDNCDITVQKDFDVVDGTVEAVVYVFAHDGLYLDNTIVKVADPDGNLYVGLLGSGNIDPGKLYDVSVALQPLVNFANEDVADGSESDPYEIATGEQFYSLMYRAAMQMRDADNILFNRKNYKLTADIQLDGHPWVPINNFNHVFFDGQGHTVSGSVHLMADYYTGLFRYAYSSVFQNLVLDLDVSFSNTNYEEYFGLLLGCSAESQIINCVNRSDISGKFWRIGSLVGVLEQRSNIVACGNTGSLTALQSCRNMGGIVATAYSFNGVIEACYNAADFKVNGVYSQGLNVGGIIGEVNADGDAEATVKNCWSNSSLIVMSNPGNAVVSNGGIIGLFNSGVLENGYWNESISNSIASWGDNASQQGGGTFAGTIPTNEQLQVMNASLASTGWAFDLNEATITENKSVVVPSIPKEEW